MPAFGIVAAVLGWSTQWDLWVSHRLCWGMIASALVGTFLGIFLAYGVAEPMAGLLDQKPRMRLRSLNVSRASLLASMQGYNPDSD